MAPAGMGDERVNDEREKVLRAISYAIRKHQGQFRKDGVTPYAAHPFRVLHLVRDIFQLPSTSPRKRSVPRPRSMAGAISMRWGASATFS